MGTSPVTALPPPTPRTTAQHCSFLTVAIETVTRMEPIVDMWANLHTLWMNITAIEDFEFATFETGGRSPTGRRLKMSHVVEDHDGGWQLSLFEQINGYRYQVIATATCGGQPQRLEPRHRVHARVEGFIRCGKDTGLARWPSHSFAINTSWITAAAIAIDLLCWTRCLLLDGPLAKAEPATLR